MPEIKNVNSITISGRIVRDVQYALNKDGSPRVYFDIACNYLRAHKLKTPYFFSCVAFGKVADKLKDTPKGAFICVTQGYLMHFVYKSPKTNRTYNNIQICVEDFLIGEMPDATAKMEQELEQAEDIIF